jgi:hypothetical protein
MIKAHVLYILGMKQYDYEEMDDRCIGEYAMCVGEHYMCVGEYDMCW